jgi:hypothetical protein
MAASFCLSLSLYSVAVCADTCTLVKASAVTKSAQRAEMDRLNMIPS